MVASPSEQTPNRGSLAFGIDAESRFFNHKTEKRNKEENQTLDGNMWSTMSFALLSVIMVMSERKQGGCTKWQGVPQKTGGFSLNLSNGANKAYDSEH